MHDLLQRADIAAVVGAHVELRKAGVHLKGLCPFHGEKTPSFVVSPSRQTYHCFGCGVHGDAIRFLMEQAGLGFVEAVHELAQQTGMAVPDDVRTPSERDRQATDRTRQRGLHDVLAHAAEHYRRMLRESVRAVEYLKRRGLSGEIAASFGLGYAPDGWRSLAGAFPAYDDPLLVEAGLIVAPEPEASESAKRYDRFRDRIMFPIRSTSGEVIAFGGRIVDAGEPKYLNSPETPLFVKGRELYGLFEARAAVREAGYALVVEGYMDVVALAQHGLANAVATLGTACSADHVRKLFRFTDSIVFAFDGDEAGRRAAGRALEASLPWVAELRSARFLFLPAEDDPDSYVRRHGKEGFRQRVAQALPLSAMLMQVASAGIDPATPEGRARLLAQARPLMALLPGGLLKEQLLAQFARSGGIAPETLSALWRDDPRGGGTARTNPATAAASSWTRVAPRRLARSAATLLDRAAWLMLHRSELWHAVAEDDRQALCERPFPYGAFFRWLDRRMHEHGAQSVGDLSADLTEEPTAADAAALRSFLQQLLELHEPGPAVDALAEWTMISRALRLEAVKDELNLLIEAGELSEEALARRRELVDLQTNLKVVPLGRPSGN